MAHRFQRDQAQAIGERIPKIGAVGGARPFGHQPEALKPEHVIDVAERVAPASHITQLRLTVAENNAGAQRLYARSGFRIVEGAATYDRGQRALRMVRPLKSTSR